MKNTTSRPKIFSGYRCGKLTVISDTENRKNGYIVWLCQCDCGAQTELDTRSLQRGAVCSCGCDTNTRPGQKDITGRQFGKLTALAPTVLRDQKGATIWQCRCECGNEVATSISQLTKGYKKSCGCLGRPPIKDHAGKRFGRLTVMEYAGKESGMHRWKCLCDCGNSAVVGQTQLQSGKTKSCGCLQAEIVIENMKYIDGTSVTRLENAGKRTVSANTSGYNGVYLNRKSQKWVAQIGFKGRNYYLGSFSELEDAVKIRNEAEKRIYGQFLEWYYEMCGNQKASPDSDVGECV